ncbi:hypothetical protein PV11_04723 [Exophiala sideris]|uniref:PA14 domain-containing protein n=1 Tax=Exophiala sideris TaxID=1016849 RepID=A0A0D1W1I4_9EURO|nr:hypothetical protein PV11_04723 [Exophiala sideris]
MQTKAWICLFGALVEAARAQSTPLATITPCPAAPALNLEPITVTTQYQPVFTCEPSSTCRRSRCTTIYPLQTYEYVSTVIPCPYGLSSVSTVTRTEQSVLVSRATTTITGTTLSTMVAVVHGTPTTSVLLHRDYTTVSKEWSAPYNSLGPLAIAGYPGSGLCTDCDLSQTLEVIECINSRQDPIQCRSGLETWIVQALPTSSAAVAHCSSTTAVPSAGVYTFTWTQICEAFTLQAPARTVTITIGGNEHPSLVVSTIQATSTVFPEQQWMAVATRSCNGPTTISFEVDVTKTFIYQWPQSTMHDTSPSKIPEPAGWSDWEATTAASTAVTPTTLPVTSSISIQPVSTTTTDSATSTTTVTSSVFSSTTSVSSSSSTTVVASSMGSTSSTSSPTSTTANASVFSTALSSAIALTTSSVSTSGLTTSSASALTATTSGVTLSGVTTSSGTTTASGIVTSSSTTPNPLGSTASTSVASSSQATTITRLTTAIPSTALTSTTTTTSMSATGFVLRITATPSGLRRRQSGLQFLGFDANDNSIAVTDPDSAALIFEGDGSTLLSNGMYLGTEVDQEGPVERVSTMPAGFHDWIFVGGLAQLQGTTGFCLGGDGIISAIVSNSACSNNISLVRAASPLVSSTASTSSSTFNGTTSVIPTTTLPGPDTTVTTTSGTPSAPSTLSTTTIGPVTTKTSFLSSYSVTTTISTTPIGPDTSTGTTTTEPRTSAASGSTTSEQTRSTTAGPLTTASAPETTTYSSVPVSSSVNTTVLPTNFSTESITSVGAMTTTSTNTTTSMMFLSTTSSGLTTTPESEISTMSATTESTSGSTQPGISTTTTKPETTTLTSNTSTTTKTSTTITYGTTTSSTDSTTIAPDTNIATTSTTITKTVSPTATNTTAMYTAPSTSVSNGTNTASSTMTTSTNSSSTTVTPFTTATSNTTITTGATATATNGTTTAIVTTTTAMNSTSTTVTPFTTATSNTTITTGTTATATNGTTTATITTTTAMNSTSTTITAFTTAINSTTTGSIDSTIAAPITTTTPTTTTTATTTTTTTEPPPTLVLPSPTYIYDPDTQGDADDDYYTQNIPVSVSLYGDYSETLYTSSNGLIGLTAGTVYYETDTLPSEAVPPNTAAPYWADLQLLADHGHGIWYSYVDGVVYVEYICTSFEDTSKYFHFQTTFDTATPNFVTYHYYEMGTGLTNNIGVQQSSTSGYTFAGDSDPNYGMVVQCDTTVAPGSCVQLS